MKFRKLFLLPLLLTLSSCEFQLFGNNDSSVTGFKDTKVTKAITISKNKKAQLQQETKNVFVRDWVTVATENSKPSLYDSAEYENVDHLNGETYISFEDKHYESRLVEKIDGVNYSLPIIIDYVNDKYEYHGALGVFFEYIYGYLGSNWDIQKYTETLMNASEQNLYFSDSIVNYIDKQFESSNNYLDSFPKDSDIYNDIIEELKNVFSKIENGLKANLKCVEDKSNGNFILEITEPIECFTYNLSSTKVSYYIDSYRLAFNDYKLLSTACFLNFSYTSNYSGESIKTNSYICTFSEFHYNVDPAEHFSDAIDVLSEEEVRELINKTEE